VIVRCYIYICYSSVVVVLLFIRYLFGVTLLFVVELFTLLHLLLLLFVCYIVDCCYSTIVIVVVVR
jgi:hypothetical protein